MLCLPPAVMPCFACLQQDSLPAVFHLGTRSSPQIFTRMATSAVAVGVQTYTLGDVCDGGIGPRQVTVEYRCLRGIGRQVRATVRRCKGAWPYCLYGWAGTGIFFCEGVLAVFVLFDCMHACLFSMHASIASLALLERHQLHQHHCAAH